MRLARFVAAASCLSAMLVVAGCYDNDITIPPLPDNGLVRIANAALASNTALDLYVTAMVADTTQRIEQRLLSNVAPGAVTPFQSLPIGNYRFVVTRAGARADVLQDDTLTLLGGVNNAPLAVSYLGYSRVVSGTAVPRVDGLIENFVSPPANTAAVRLHNLVPGGGSVYIDIGADDGVVSGTTPTADFAGELVIGQFSNTEDPGELGLTGGVRLPASQPVTLAIYRASGGVLNLVGRFVVNLASGAQVNAVLVGDPAAAGSTNAPRLLLYTMNGDVQVVQRS